MALNKSIELKNGVVVQHHRITSLNIITNVQNVIEISCYTSEKKRKEEQDALKKGSVANIFVHTIILPAPYDQTETIEEAYEYLKTLPLFKGATDV